MIHTYSTQKCGRWDFCFFCIIPVKSTDSGFSIDTILPKWGKNGANIKITILNESLEDVNKNLFTTHSEYKTSANTLKKNGIYYSTTWLDTAGNYGVLIVFGDNSSYISQFFINAVDGALWFRNTNNGTTWIEWKRIV